MTDNEIIKALEEILELMCNEGDLQRSATISKALDLINRLQADKKYYKKNRDKYQDDVMFLSMQCDELQAENERLKHFEDKIAEFNSHIRVEDMLVFASSLEEWLEFMQKTKAEAYKEFAEKMKENTQHLFSSVSINKEVDNLLKKLVGEDK